MSSYLILVADRIADLTAEVREVNENLARIADAWERAAAGAGKPGSERPCEGGENPSLR